MENVDTLLPAGIEIFYAQNSTLEHAYYVAGLHIDLDNLTYTIRLEHDSVPATTNIQEATPSG
jgi:hypothetical protein